MTFPLFEKIDVNGDEQHPIYEELEQQGRRRGRGRRREVELREVPRVAPDGEVVGRFRPQVTPEDPALVAAIEAQLPEAKAHA